MAKDVIYSATYNSTKCMGSFRNKRMSSGIHLKDWISYYNSLKYKQNP